MTITVRYTDFTDVDRNRRRGVDVDGVFVSTFSIINMGEFYNETDWQYALYWKSTGQRVLSNTVFSNQEGCVMFGKLLKKFYDPYLLIHPYLPEVNFFQLVKWTVPKGLFLAALFEASEYFALARNDVLVSMADMYKRYNVAAHKRVQYYTRGNNWYVDNYGTKTEVA